jgi:hypothetical protein
LDTRVLDELSAFELLRFGLASAPALGPNSRGHGLHRKVHRGGCALRGGPERGGDDGGRGRGDRRREVELDVLRQALGELGVQAAVLAALVEGEPDGGGEEVEREDRADLR